MNSSRLPSSPGRADVAICCPSIVCGDCPCDQQLNTACWPYGSPLVLLWGG